MLTISIKSYNYIVEIVYSTIFTYIYIYIYIYIYVNIRYTYIYSFYIIMAIHPNIEKHEHI